MDDYPSRLFDPAGESLVVVANRLPVRRGSMVDRGDGRSAECGPETWVRSPGGLVTALDAVLARSSGMWVGADVDGSIGKDFVHEGLHCVPVGIAADEYRAFYEGFSNRTLWPLYHAALQPPVFCESWWQAYRAANSRFASRVAAHAPAESLVWVQDYQLQLVPSLVRHARPDVRNAFFLHIPFPPVELFARLPWARPILAGILGADLVGVQTARDAEHLLQAAEELLGARREGDRVRQGNRTTRIGAFPISIDTAEFAAVARSAGVEARTRGIREELGLGRHRKMLLGVDRLDYTKGIEHRLRAFRRMLKDGNVKPDECVMVLVAVPSREEVLEYQELRCRVEALVGRINGEFGSLEHTPIRYLRRSVPQSELVALYRAADVMLVTPLRDGMNLVAKEFAACRVDGGGVLVLSQFAGAAAEMQEALCMQPFDEMGSARVIERALRLPEPDARRRMAQMRSALQTRDVHRWAASFLGKCARPLPVPASGVPESLASTLLFDLGARNV